MPIVVNNPSKDQTQVARLSVMEGGTGAGSPVEALIKLECYPAASLGQPASPAPLNANKKFDQSVIRQKQFSNIGIDGPTTLSAGQKALYYITTFDSFKNYTVTAVDGKATLKEGYIEYEAPSKAGIAGFAIDGRAVLVTITEALIRRPTIISPYNGENVAVLYSVDSFDERYYDSLTIRSTLFFANGTTEPQLDSDWEVYLSTTLDVPAEASDHLVGAIDDWSMVAYQYQDGGKTLLDIAGVALAEIGTSLTLAVRVRHNTSNYQSIWSEFVYFKVMISESSKTNTLPRPVVTGASSVVEEYGSPYPRLVPAIDVILKDISPNQFHTRTEYKIFEGASEQPTTNVMHFYPEAGTSLYGYHAQQYFKFNQLYTIQARFFREDTSEYTAWSTPFTIITGSMPDHNVEEFTTVHVYKEIGQDGMDVVMADETLPVYEPMSRKGSFTAYTLDGLINAHLPVTKHTATQWQLSIYQDFIQLFHDVETTGELSRYAVTFNNIDFPATGFESYLDSPVFIRCRYKDASGIYSNWTPSTINSRFKLRDFL